MRSRPTARIRRALERIIPPKTARIICESTSIQGLWPLLQESLCNPCLGLPLRARLLLGLPLGLLPLAGQLLGLFLGLPLGLFPCLGLPLRARLRQVNNLALGVFHRPLNL